MSFRTNCAVLLVATLGSSVALAEDARFQHLAQCFSVLKELSGGRIDKGQQIKEGFFAVPIRGSGDQLTILTFSKGGAKSYSPKYELHTSPDAASVKTYTIVLPALSLNLRRFH